MSLTFWVLNFELIEVKDKQPENIPYKFSTFSVLKFDISIEVKDEQS